MHNSCVYHQINDGCEDCNYIVNAFTLLRLPLDIMPTNAINPDIFQDFKKHEVFVLCDLFKKNTAAFQALLASPVKLIYIHNHENYCSEKIYSLPKFFSKNQIKHVLNKVNHYLSNDFNHAHPIFERLLGSSKALFDLKNLIYQVAQTDTTVLLMGESGSGKEIVASAIHYLSARKNKTYIPINCGAIPHDLIESELFGHEKGAFTGAHNKRQGRFELAQHGTLFLDEIGDMPLSMQVKLLRVLQEKKFERVGGNCSIDSDVRIIAATNKNLENLIVKGEFRQDLYYRINVFPINVPSLAERKDDIPDLINYHLEKIYQRIHHIVHFTEQAMSALCEYHWPGNIRELENFLERMVILHKDHVLDVNDLDQKYLNSDKTMLSRSTEYKTQFTMDEILNNIQEKESCPIFG